MKFIYKVKVNDQKYIFDSKEQFEVFKTSNPSLTFEAIERIDIIEGMEKIVKPHPPDHSRIVAYVYERTKGIQWIAKTI